MKRITLTILILINFFTLVFAQDTGKIKGKVINEQDNKLADIKITARQNDQDVKSSISDLSGNFVLEELPVGNYNLVFQKYGFSTIVIYNINVKKDKTQKIDNLVLTSDKGTQVIFEGSVYNKNGLSLSKIKIEIEKISVDGKSEKVGNALTNAIGEFSISFAETTGTFRVTAYSKDKLSKKEIAVDGAAIYRFSLIL